LSKKITVILSETQHKQFTMAKLDFKTSLQGLLISGTEALIAAGNHELESKPETSTAHPEVAPPQLLTRYAAEIRKLVAVMEQASPEVRDALSKNLEVFFSLGVPKAKARTAHRPPHGEA
jgi:spore coat protein CotF